MKGRLILVSAIALSSVTGGAALAANTAEQAPRSTEAQLAQAATLGFDQARQAVTKELPGRLLALGLNDENGAPVYEATVLGADGKASIVKIDAATGAVLGKGLAANFGDEADNGQVAEIGQAGETGGETAD
jgi:uncharacterized membrane protein YkoI